MFIQRVSAAFLILLGITVMAGWFLHIPIMVQLIPGMVGMVINTALCFIMTGFILLCFNYSGTAFTRRIQVILCVLILIITLLSISQDIFNYNLGIDEFFIKSWLEDPNPTPGRMAPNTALAFMLIAAIGLLYPNGRNRSIAIILQILTFLILLIGLLGLLVYSLKLEFILTWYHYTRMAVHTSGGLMITSIALWITLMQCEWYQKFYSEREDKKIILITGIILLCISMIAALGGIAWLTYLNISAVEKSLMNTLQVKMNVIEGEVTDNESSINSAISSKFVTDALSNNQQQNARIGLLVKYFNEKDIKLLELKSANNNVIYSNNEVIKTPIDFSIPINNVKLFWQDGYWLLFTREVKINDKLVGYVKGAAPLQIMDRALSDEDKLGDTGEIVLCTAINKDKARCFPTRFYHKIVTIPLKIDGKPLPISYALSGAKGIIRAMDYRKENVIAAYGSLFGLQLGIALKIDVSEVYKPINDQLKYILPAVILFICGGLILLYWQVVPLVKKVVTSEQEANLARIKLEQSLNELSQRNTEINLLRELSAKLQLCIDSDESIQLISKYGKRLFPEYNGILFLTNQTINFLEPVLVFKGSEPVKIHFRPEDCWALRLGYPYYIKHEHDEILCNHVQAMGETHFPMICLPLYAQDAIMGVLHLSALNQTHKDLPDDNNKLLVADAFCEQIAIGLSNVRLREKLRNQSIHDPLTGLFNRRYLEEMLAGELKLSDKSNKPLSLLLLDIDHFKSFNDNYGHDAGDAVLVGLSNVIQSHIRSRDFLCRHGGEEFIFIMSATSRDMAVKRAEEIHQSVRTLQVNYGSEILRNITISIGVATYPEDGRDAEALIRSADLALYHAKNSGRNKTVIYQPGLQSID